MKPGIMHTMVAAVKASFPAAIGTIVLKVEASTGR